MIFFELCWWSLAFKHDLFSLFPDRYILSITMVFGATVAGIQFEFPANFGRGQLFVYFLGMTSEGGGAVAFPVMTLALGIAPAVARGFSLMIQSCGETKTGVLSEL